jgi:hypothetical protein
MLGDSDQVLHGRYDKIDLPPVRPVVTRVERYAGCCSCCGGTTVAPVPEGLEAGSPFGPGINARNDLDPRHGTVPCRAANDTACRAAIDRPSDRLRKAAFPAGIRTSQRNAPSSASSPTTRTVSRST